MIMDKRTIALFNNAYDSIYNLDSKVRYRFKWLPIAMEELEKEALKWGYEFKLKQSSQKFKLVRIKK